MCVWKDPVPSEAGLRVSGPVSCSGRGRRGHVPSLLRWLQRNSRGLLVQSMQVQARLDAEAKWNLASPSPFLALLPSACWWWLFILNKGQGP